MKPRLLIVELHHLGDAVMSLPFVRGASARHEVHVLCRPSVAPVFRQLADAPRLHEWEPPWADDRKCGAAAALRAARETGRRLKTENFDGAVCAWADARCGLLIAETRAARRVGFPMTHGNYYAADWPWRRKRRLLGRVLEAAWKMTHPHFPMFTHALHRAGPTQAHIRCWEQIAQALNVSCNDAVPWVRTPSPPEALAGFHNTCRRQRRQILAIHAHARLPGKQWPIAMWKQLLSLPETAARFSVIEIVPPGQEPLQMPGSHIVSTPDIPALTAVLNTADAVLCHDSFPAHLAAALGKPVVTIFGAGEPDWFAPWGNRGRVVQQRGCPHHPYIDRCDVDHYLCLDRIKPGDVLRQLELLPRTP